MSAFLQQPLVSIGNYRLSHRNLGKGTFAKVELASHTILGAEVALKITFKSDLAARDPYMAKHLYRECNLLARVRGHPNIVKLLEVCDSTEVHCLVLERIRGGTLFDLIKDRGPLREPPAQYLAAQLVSALHYLHNKAKILHRDIKLENILLDDDFGARRLVLIDFGLSNEWRQGKYMKTHCGSAGIEIEIKHVYYIFILLKCSYLICRVRFS